MPEGVKVEDFEVFRLFRLAMLKFAQMAGQSLANADSEVARMRNTLEGDLMSHWQLQLRKRTEALAKARDALRMKKLYKDSSGRTPDASEEMKIVARCAAAVEEADNKIKAIRSWLPKLEKAAGMYRGGTAALNRTLTGDIPNALARMDRLAQTLEGYVQIEAPVTQTPEGVGLPAAEAVPTAEESMSRGDVGAPEPPEPPEASEAPEVADAKIDENGPETAGNSQTGASPPEAPVKEKSDVAAR